MGCQFRPTRHAKYRMHGHCITKGEIREAIDDGTHCRQGGKLVSRLRRLEVVWCKRPCNHIIITTYWRERK